MSPVQLRAALPRLIGLSLVACAGSIVLAVYLGIAARNDASEHAARELAVQAGTLARQLESDLAQFDLALRDAANRAPRETNPASAKPAFPELPLTAQYLGFMNVLNEVGDVIADSRSNVSRPVNFAGRDYFQDHLKNPADVLMIGRPFATAPNQHASIPISRRLNHADGSFAGLVVAGVRLTWLSDLLSHPTSVLRASVTIRRDDGLILMHLPYDAGLIGRGGDTDPVWQAFLRAGQSSAANTPDGVRLFRRLGAPLVLELALDHAEIVQGVRAWLIWLPLLALIPGLAVLGLSFMASRVLRRGDEVETAARAASDEHMRLLANMSHELRTPLTGILGQAELMADEGGFNDRQATRLTRLTEAGTLMRGVINRVIDVARPADRTETPVLEPCDLDQLSSTCLGMVEGEARRKGLRVTSAIDAETPRLVMLARDLLQQVLINLLMNAVKFTSEGAVSLHITGDATRLWFEVSDTGPGIPARKRRRLFHEYDRLDMPAAHAEGTGLGLSITEGFVRRMGGRIGSIERKGGGSIFWVELPSAEPDPTIAATAKPPTPVPVSETRPLCILLADDLDVTRTVTADFLRSAGHVVSEVSDGETAIAEVQERDFDVVLTDMRMPVVDGLEVTRRIRALPGHRGRTPVVLVTADLAALDRGASGQTGVDVCVRKPFTRTELLTAVASAALLIPISDEPTAGNPVIDEAAQYDLRQHLSETAFDAQLDAAARRIGAMLDLLDGSDVIARRDAAHDLIGIAGLLGLNGLAACLARFDSAPDGMEATAALRTAASGALRALHLQLQPAAMR